MIHLFKTCMITAFILGLTWSAPLRAQDQRYISIRNTDTIWLREIFEATSSGWKRWQKDRPLTILCNSKDKYGQTLVTRKWKRKPLVTVMPREPQTHFKRSAWKMSPQLKSLKQLKKVTAIKVSLPLSVFDPQDYHPLLITVSGKTLTDPLKSVSCFSLCHNAWQRLFYLSGENRYAGLHRVCPG